MVDKSCIIQILGSLMKQPQFLSDKERYNLSPADFKNKFHQYIFMAISRLYGDGAKKITPVDIVGVFENNPGVKTVFDQNKGIEYLQDAEEFSEPENFEVYYNRLKKINLLRDLKGQGIDISEFYIEDLTNEKALEVNSRFEDLKLGDIIAQIKKKVLCLEGEYLKNDVSETRSIFDGLEELLENLADNPDIGLPLQGVMFNEIVSGARKGAFYIRSGGSGVSKTRQAVGDACQLAFPLRYNDSTCEWEKCGCCEKILFIATEQNFDEIQKMVLAYLSGVNEDKIRNNRMSERERTVLNQAVQVLRQYEKNFLVVRMPSPTIELVKHIVRENCLMNDIGYVFYDYIFIGPSLLSEFKGFNLRNDEVLLMFSTALKDLAVELNVFVMSSTQVNANGDDSTNIRNESTLAGGRATINKADIGAVMARPTKEELKILESYIATKGKTPNIVTDIYKVRSGRYNQVRIWSEVNLGNLRKEDLFITDNKLEILDDFEGMVPFFYEDEENTELDNLIKELNSI